MNRIFTGSGLKIAVIGGGTGSFTLLSALKNHTSSVAALVNMADDGGSTGILRDELGTLPPGDVRQCLVALSSTPELRELFNYRFEEGSFKGHAFGNIFLTALEKMSGDFAGAVKLASEVLNITGVVEPITLTNVRLVMRDSSGKETHGEFAIARRKFNGKQPEFWLEPKAKANPRALAAINQADIVVIAPGNLYGSLGPALIVQGIGQALSKTKALKIYVCNLVTKPGQTDGYTVTDFANEIERLANVKFLDVVLFNTEPPNSDLLKKYAKKGELAVEYDQSALVGATYRILGANLISGRIWQNNSQSDFIAAARTLIRHDPDTTSNAIISIYQKTKKR